MTAILRQLPFQEREDEISVGLERVPIRAYQIILWASLTTRDVLHLPPHAPRFPVVLDTGHGHNFSLHERHVTSWAQLSLDRLPKRGETKVNDQPVPLHRAKVWLIPNEPGKRDAIADHPPFSLELPEGIAIHSASSFPRLPLLGLRAIVRNRLHLNIDAVNNSVNLRTTDWRTKLIRLLS